MQNIKNLLNIKDKNIHILTNQELFKRINNINYKIVERILTYTPAYCTCCGIANHSHNDIIKWEFKRNCKVKIPKISNNTELQIRLELMKKQSEKDIAERTNVSVSKVDRILNDISSHTVLRHPTLPTTMN